MDTVGTTAAVDPILTLINRRAAACAAANRIAARIEANDFNAGLTREVCDRAWLDAQRTLDDAEDQIAKGTAATLSGAIEQAAVALEVLAESNPRHVAAEILARAIPVIGHLTGIGPAMSTDWRPAGLRSVMVSHVEPDDPLVFVMEPKEEGGEPYAIRPSDEQARGYLIERPYDAEHFRPARLRQLLAGYDGELFALIAEERKAKTAERRAEISRTICTTPAVTDIGNAMKLERLMRDDWNGVEKIPHDARRALMAGVHRWLIANALQRGLPMERRAIDIEKEATTLRSCFDPAEQHAA